MKINMTICFFFVLGILFNNSAIQADSAFGELANESIIRSSDFVSLQDAFNVVCFTNGPRLVINSDVSLTSTVNCGSLDGPGTTRNIQASPTFTGRTFFATVDGVMSTSNIHVELAEGVTVSWDGVAGGTMFNLNAVRDFTFTGGTVDCLASGGQAERAFDILSDDDTITSNVFIDTIIKDCGGTTDDGAVSVHNAGVSAPDDQSNLIKIRASFSNVDTCFSTNNLNSLQSSFMPGTDCEYRERGMYIQAGGFHILPGTVFRTLGSTPIAFVEVQDMRNSSIVGTHWEGLGAGIVESGTQTAVAQLTVLNSELFASGTNQDSINWNSTLAHLSVMNSRFNGTVGNTFNILIPNGMRLFLANEGDQTQLGTVNLDGVTVYVFGTSLIPGLVQNSTPLTSSTTLGATQATDITPNQRHPRQRRPRRLHRVRR